MLRALPRLLLVLAALGLLVLPGDEASANEDGRIAARYGPKVRRTRAQALKEDLDRDTIPDKFDKCPGQREDFDGFEDEDGCPEMDNDLDRIPDVYDQCPDEKEDIDGFQDEDGCPDLDNDMDGIPDRLDACPNQAEDMDGFEDLGGCPDPDNDGDGILDVNAAPTSPSGSTASTTRTAAPTDGDPTSGGIEGAWLESSGSPRWRCCWSTAPRRPPRSRNRSRTTTTPPIPSPSLRS